MNKIKSIVFALLIIGVVSPQLAVGQQIQSCGIGEICVQPSNYLKYADRNIFGQNSTITFNFEKFVDPHNINVTIASTNNNGTTTTYSILNLQNYTLIHDGTHQRFIQVQPIPMKPSITKSFQNESINFNGITREAFGFHFHNATDSTDFDFDKTTGVLMSLSLTHTAYVLNQSATVGFSSVLIDTNMFVNSQANASSVTIPQWIKNNAKWWSSGQIADSEFIKGIQYLIQNGIMKIPQTQSGSGSSQQIPSWIKNNAGWWADGQISDDEFVKGIQYLVNNGIIKVEFSQ